MTDYAQLSHERPQTFDLECIETLVAIGKTPLSWDAQASCFKRGIWVNYPSFNVRFETVDHLSKTGLVEILEDDAGQYCRLSDAGCELMSVEA